MVVAMVAVRMMQVAVDEIVDVVAVRHRLVPATWPMLMTRLVPGAAMLGRAAVGILRRDLDHVLVDMVAVHVMQVPIVQVVDMIAMPHGGVATVGTVLVCVIGVMRFFARRHGGLPACAIFT